MERRSPSNLNKHIYTEACAWFVECRTGTLDAVSRREFDRWLRRSPEHLTAYLEIAAIWNEGPSLDPQRRWSADDLIAEAAADRDNIVSLDGSDPPMRQDSAREPAGAAAPVTIRRPRLPMRFPHAIAASIAIVVLAIGALVSLTVLRNPTYSTGVGEQRSVMLADGSTVELNSRSKVRVRYSKRERALELLEGQALFVVAADRARPFVVTSGDTRVRAVGTQFDVYKKRSGTIVTVVEGRVAVLTSALEAELEAVAADPAALAGPPPLLQLDEQRAGAGVLLSAGEQAVVTSSRVEASSHADVTRAIAWRQRQLVFDSASLVEVAEEFNRYNERQLIVRDPDLYDFHISGVFSSTDPMSLIRFLRERPGVQVIEKEAEIQVRKGTHEEVTDQ